VVLWGTSNKQEVVMVKQFKIIVEKHPDGYVAYPLGLKGVVVGEGDTYEEALADAKSAIQFHIETFNSSQRMLFVSLRGGTYEHKE
jgi:predicted RNase H-like HicB family nuclease